MGLDDKRDAILFDLDGTLFDTYGLLSASFNHAVDEVLGGADIAHFNATIGQPLDVQFLWYAQGDEALRDRLSASYRTYNNQVHDQLIRRFEGMEQALQRLKENGWSLGVVTSKRHASALRAIDLFGASGYFGCLVGSDDVAVPKPAPDPLLRGAELLGRPAKACWYVGDSPYDLRAAHAAGCGSIAALWGMYDADVLRAEQPEVQCAIPIDLPSAVGAPAR